MTIPRIPLVLFAAACAAATLTGQTPADASAPADIAAAPRSLPWPAHVLTDVAPDGTLWAGHADWKASFAANGTTFHPFLGGDVPGVHATFALGAVRIGGEELPLVVATPRLQHDCVSFDRGVVRECYDLLTSGLEQRFVFDTLPVRADLRLDVTVATDLAVSAGADGHTLLGQHGGLRYGNAIAIDARGRRCDVPVQFADGAFHLTVPADFVAAATMPLIVDPFVGSISTLTGTSDKELLATDIAFDQSLGQFFVTYERAFSASDHDVYVVHTDQNLAAQGTLTIDFTNEYWTRPRIATLEAHDTVCVVAQTSAGNVSPFAVKLRMLLGGSPPLLQPVQSMSTGNGDDLEPDIGGDPDPVGPSRFLIAYEKLTSQPFSSIRCRLVDALGSWITETSVLASATGRLQRVAVGKTCGKAGLSDAGWGLLYRYVGFGQTIGQLRTSFLDNTGTWHAGPGGSTYGIVGPITPNAGSEWDISTLTDHQNGRNMLCVENRIDPANGKGSLHATLVNSWCTTLVATTQLLGSSADHRQPVVDSDGARFVMAFAKVYSATDHDVRALALSSDGNQIFVASNEFVSAALDEDTQPAICAVAGQYGQYALAWPHSNGSAWTMQAQRFTTIGQGLYATRTTGCGATGIGLTGSWTIGQSFTATFAPPTGIAAMLAGAPVSLPIGPCPGCTLGVDGSLFVGGQLTIVVPFVPSLIGAVLSLQGVKIEAQASDCLGLFRLGTTYDLTLL